MFSTCRCRSYWPTRLAEAVDVLSRRRGKFGIGGDPALLAAVLRGLNASGQDAPDWLLQAAAQVLGERRSAESVAELADALAQHRTRESLVANAVAGAFRSDEWPDEDAPYARWWLASRCGEVERQLSSRAIDDARLQALATADPHDFRAAAMVLEAAARAVDQLVIATGDTLSAARSRRERHAEAVRALYGGLLLSSWCLFGILQRNDVAHWLDRKLSVANAHYVRQVLVALLAASLAFIVAETAKRVALALGHKPPAWVQYIEVVGTVVAGAVGGTTA
jgi:hypothetical protein